MASAEEFAAIRAAIASLPADVSHDAIGAARPTIDEVFAPATHAAALDPHTPIVQGARGAGKSFWAGVLLHDDVRKVAHDAYPHVGLDRLQVRHGYTGISGPQGGIDREKLDDCVGHDASLDEAKVFWWATILRALKAPARPAPATIKEHLATAKDIPAREKLLAKDEERLLSSGQTLLVVYDALDTVAIKWPRRRLLTEALLEVAWSMRAYRAIRLKLFLRPDQLDDDLLRFVELPKQRSGAVRLEWSQADLYGLLFSRLALGEAKKALGEILDALRLPRGTPEEIRKRAWPLGYDTRSQAKLMTALCGPYMGGGDFGHKKGKTYDWPIAHLGDAFKQVTPRSFLGLMIAAAKEGVAPPKRSLTPDGIRHGLRSASKTRVDQLHQEFPWIKGVLAPLAGLLLPQHEREVFRVWESAGTVTQALNDAEAQGYLPPFPVGSGEAAPAGHERDLYLAMERIGVMLRRPADGRLDMPDLFRVAAKLLKKGATAPNK
jgi:hypothetical protein